MYSTFLSRAGISLAIRQIQNPIRKGPSGWMTSVGLRYSPPKLGKGFGNADNGLDSENNQKSLPP
jgi:hypothetical protein